MTILSSIPAGHISVATIVSRYWAVDPEVAGAAQILLANTSVAELERMRLDFVERQAQAREGRRSRGEAEDEVLFKMSDKHDGLAEVSMTGVMTKRSHCLSDLFGGGDASTMAVEKALTQAANDPKVRDTAFIVETPGGDVNGAFDLSDTVFKLNQKKPIYTYVSDQATSGGTLVGSQSSRVFANSNALNGSIGVYTTLTDSSDLYKQRGVKMMVVKAGKYKAIGAPGQPITEEDAAVVQDRVNDYHKLFLKNIVRQRMITPEQLKNISDAQVFVGSKGVDAGLVDEIASYDDAIRMARSGKGRINNKVGVKNV